MKTILDSLTALPGSLYAAFTRPEHVVVEPVNLASYNRADVEAVILKGFDFHHPDGESWAKRAKRITDFTFMVAPAPFTSIAHLRSSVNVEYLLPHKQHPLIAQYLYVGLPGLPYLEKIQHVDKVDPADIEKWKNSQSFYMNVMSVVEGYLDRWDVVLGEAQHDYIAPPPFSFGDLIRYRQEKKTWPQQWREWFVTGRSS